MRTRKQALLALAAAAAALTLAERPARAQLDIDPPLPNVLLLVDTSGSMEYLVAPDATGKSQLPGSVAGSACDGKPSPSLLNRWATLVTVLTGQINNFACMATPRDDTFANEYSFLGTRPYDTGYYLPFHRLLSNGCTTGPGVNPTNYWDWPIGAIRYHDIASPATTCASAFSQVPDGILDTFRDRVRFGMMTFDTLTDPGTGSSGTKPDAVTGMAGMWSYYAGWNTGSGLYKQGFPPACAPTAFEVGARNPAAPPWEGRLMPFGAPDAALLDVQTTNDHIQEALLAMRPYGATPIDGLFDDASEFLRNDTTTDPSTSKPFGPSQDLFVQGGCRKSYIILLSDGEPNLDLRPDCAQAGGSCPYPKPADVIAGELASQPGSPILTYVVGLGVSNPSALGPLGLTSCTQIDPAVHCVNPPAGLKACCALSRIASAGGTNHAYFADDLVSLRSQLSGVLANISSGSTARTVPVFGSTVASTAQGTAAAAGYRFLSRFKTSKGTGLWSGQIDRERYVCGTQSGKLTATLQPVNASSGDDFASNLNTYSPTRKFFTFAAPALPDGSIRSDLTLRPNLTASDGLGTYGSGGTPTSIVDGPTFASTLASNTWLLGIDPLNAPQPCSTTLKTTSSSSCVDMLVRWHVGEVNPSLPDTRSAASCPVPGACSALGAVYHSTPAVVGAPSDVIRDESHTAFALANAKRPMMLFAASTDGQLHAFKVAAGDPTDTAKVDGQKNNELWSFLPPIVLPRLLTAYNQQEILTDGAPVVGDVVFEKRRGTAGTWHTVLVAGGGSAGGFYYALDVTDPTKPKFLWQLANDSSAPPLFSLRGTPQPAIATVTIPDGSDFKEVAVAILSGGAPSFAGGSCPRDNTGALMKSAKYTPRGSVRCWAQAAGARTLTVVRIDTGEILMSFRGDATDGPPGLVNNSQVVNFTSPMTGIPVAYPAQTGEVADRIYVGDADGALWRIDLSTGNPKTWTAKLAWDAYPLSSDTDQIGQPVQTTPIIATNALGDTVIAFSTGDQDLPTATASMDTRLWSLIEKRNPVSGGSFEVKENFYKQFLGGDRVTGPMTIFASVLYFSSFAPASVVAGCNFGGSAVWALDYQTAAPRFPDPLNPAVYKSYEPAPNTIIYGVALTQTPTCAESNCSSDAFFGTNCYYTQLAGGGYEVAWQKGPGNGVTTNSLVKTGADGTQTLSVPSPQQSTRIDSWAGILE
jgi:type IV pilus assembly protein PilY1